MKKTQKNPNHIAVIMDGNGTWSKRKGLSKKQGHQRGVKSAKNFTSYSLDAGIKNLTLFALSNENLLRSKFELSNLFDIFLLYDELPTKGMLGTTIFFKSLFSLIS